ncbi:protein lifeguard 1-like isoform X1 [Pungitius pungitius]|uniref:protein lifeguard 1-like isoform X1 n=2 Tax=Pungitius pungitius TaxID=134920 RepID=UPI002E0D4DA4
MCNSPELLVSKETMDAPCYVSSPPAPPAAPPLLSFKGPPSPPYPAASSKTKMTRIHQPAAGYGSLLDFHTEASTDTTLLMDSSSSDDHKVRRAFTKKVFWILTLQLLFSFGVLCASFFVVKDAHNKWLYVGSLLTFGGFTAALSICKSFSQRHPWNMEGWTHYYDVLDALLMTLTVDVVAFAYLHVLD